MATSKIKKRQIENLQIVDADVAAGAAIATSKLADGTSFMKKDGLGGNYNANNLRILGVADPVADSDAVPWGAVKNLIAGLSPKEAVRAATTANITLSGTQTIDAVAVVAGDRVLVKNQTNASQNGIYVCATGVWSRASDADAVGELKAGSSVFVAEGTVNGDSGWLISTDGTITIGTTPISWIQYTGAGQIGAGAGLTKTGNTIDVVSANISRIVVNPDSIDLATTGVSTGTYQGIVIDAYGRVTSASNQSYLATSNYVSRETPAGTKNAVNKAFSLAFVPVIGSEMLFLNGQLLRPGAGNDYTISGLNITMDIAPETDSDLVCTYIK